VLLRWQEFATRSVAVFFDMPPWWRCRWGILVSVGVKARVVNWKQVDVAASRSSWLSWNALIAHCSAQNGRECTKWDRRDGLTQYSAYTVPAVQAVLSFASELADVQGRAGGVADWTWLTVHSHGDQMTLPKWGAVFRTQCPERPPRTL